MSEIKLVYFDIRARGESIRMVLEAAGKKYEDVRITYDKWPEEKPKTPYGQVPYVVLIGKQYGQSVAIASYFAREYGLYGKSNLDALRIDEVVHLSLEIGDAAKNVKFEKDEAKKEELGKKLEEETVPKFLGFFQRLLQDNGNSGFFVGSTVTLADIFVYNTLDFVVKVKPNVAQTFPVEVTKNRSMVEAHPFLKSYLANRKDAPF